MVRNCSARFHGLYKRFAALIICLVICLAALPVTAGAAREEKLVRVGWYESSFNTTDSSGRRSGYAYEYQMKLAAYAGWKFVYVHGSWSELMELLMSGEIDLMSDVSYTEERAQKMLFPELSMGTEEYYLFISPDNTQITPEDYSTFNGRRIGMNQGSVQYGQFLHWEEQHGVKAEIVELTCEESESLRMLDTGELDGYITPNTFRDPTRLAPVCKIGSSEFYFAVNRDRPDLLADLNAAMSRIQDENPYYNQRMFEKHVQRLGANAFLTAGESAWLSGHGTVRVGYQDNYLAFCATDPETGELTGALRDYLDYAEGCFNNGSIDFEAKSFPTAAAALEALERGEVDCVFPANLSAYDGETMDLVMTPSIMRTDMYAVVRQADQSFFSQKEHVIVAVNKGNPNYDAFLLDNYPEWRRVYYENTAECLRAVHEGLADCVLVSSFRYNNISRLCDKYDLEPFSTGIGLDYAFALREGDTELYSVLAKIVGLVPSSTVNASLSYYNAEDARLDLMDYLEENLAAVALVVMLVLLVILGLLIHSLRTARKAKELIAATEIDKLTGLFNRDYFFQYANRMYREHPELPRDAMAINIEQFHSINALNGRDVGDRILRDLGSEIRAVAHRLDGIAGRSGADRFEIYCSRPESYEAVLDRLQERIEELAPGTGIRLRMGVMPAQEGMGPVQLFDQARTACNLARGRYQEHLIVFDEEVRQRETRSQRLLGDLQRALDNYEFEVYYQPKYNIQEEPPRLVSAEALIRWQHPELGLIPPDDFIPLFERNGKIGAVDKFVWDQAARQIARWRAQYGVTIPVSVNLSRVDIFDPALESTLDAILRQNGLEHSALKLEVTESAYTENAGQVIALVERLRAQGYTVEMDDFGTGYSSLNMLSAMPIDVLKMDRTFIRNIEHSEKDIQLVALILGIARSLKIPVIAEGVETESQLRLLKDLGCLLVQGYYFSRPLHPTDFEDELLQGLDNVEDITRPAGDEADISMY